MLLEKHKHVGLKITDADCIVVQFFDIGVVIPAKIVGDLAHVNVYDKRRDLMVNFACHKGVLKKVDIKDVEKNEKEIDIFYNDLV